MTIGFHVERINYYRFYSPIIDYLIKKKFKVTCFHDYGQPQQGFKSDLFPRFDKTPEAFRDTISRVEYHGKENLKNLIQEHQIDFFISVWSPNAVYGNDVLPRKVKWIALQFGFDFFAVNQWQELKNCSLISLYSIHWLDFAERFHSRIEHPNIHLEGCDILEEKKIIIKKCISIGWPQVDQLKDLDTSVIRRKWNLPEGKKVVVFLPLDVDSFGENEETTRNRNLYYQKSRWEQCKLVFSDKAYWKWRYLKKVILGINDAALVAKIKEFCDKNNAILIVKSRKRDTTKKQQVPIYLEAVADKVVYDESFYPATIMEVLKIANLCINFYSLAVTEAAHAHVPCVSVKPFDRYSTSFKELKNFSGTFFEFCDFDIFDAPFIEKITADDFIENFGNRSLKNFSSDELNFKNYIDYYFTGGDKNASEKLVKLLMEQYEKQT